MILESGCVHWWVIGDYSLGHCKKCGITRDFEKLRQEEKPRKLVGKASMIVIKQK